MEKLEALTSRLERAVERLEKAEVVATTQRSYAAPARATPQQPTNSITTSRTSSSGAASPSLDILISTYLAPFTETSQSIGDEVAKVSAIVQRAFQACRDLVSIASQSKKPTDQDLQKLIQPLAEQLNAGNQLTEGRRTAAFNHYKTAAEALQAFCFVLYTGPSCGLNPPSQTVGECWQSAEFWANKVTMEFRNKDQRHVDWVRAFKELMTQLQKYVAQSLPQGLVWNPTGGSALDTKPSPASTATPAPAPAACETPAPTPPAPEPSTPPPPEPTAPPTAAPAAPAPAPATGAPPPPPPPPPAGYMAEKIATASAAAAAVGASTGAAADGGTGGLSAIFAELNKGDSVTSGLRKVTADMKTKNRAERTGAVPAAAKPAAAAPAAKASGVPKGEPKMELQQKKWVVEYQVGNKEVVLDDTQPHQTVYIYGCVDTVVQIKAKINSISLDSCKRTGLVFQEVIASVEAVNCTSCQVQVLGQAPTVTIDKCDGIQVFLPAAIAKDPDQGGVQVVTAKSSELNITVVPDMKTNSEADPVEHPVPEQFISTFKDGKLVTVAAVHSGN